MVDENVVKEYTDSINSFHDQCLNAGMSEEEFRKLYFESLQSLGNRNQESPRRESFKTRYKILCIMVVVIGLNIYYYNSIYSYIVCQLQDYIYPGLRLLRKIAIPLLSLFPSLTDLYHETCLIQNPFFTVADMDCWPCSSINNVREISDPKPSHQRQNAPFMYETDQQIIDLELLQKIYNQNNDIMNKETMKVLVNNKYYIYLHEMFTQNVIKDNNLYVWKINNVHIAKLLRQFIPRPVIVPKFGQSTERFIIIDSSQNTFKVPDTECNYSFLLSLSGSRTINLVPAEECKQQCKSLKVELKETHLLWYNWWYWRPIVQPTTSNITFIAHIGSYC